MDDQLVLESLQVYIKCSGKFWINRAANSHSVSMVILVIIYQDTR